MTFSFLHCADIHLGRPFSNISGNTNICKKAVEQAFNNLIDLAIVKNVDFVFIAGDTFDSEEQDFESKIILKEGLKKLDNSNIKVYLICGNHDPLSSYNKTTFNFDENSNIEIIGLNSDLYSDFILENKNNEKVAVLHALSFKENYLKENPTKYFTPAQDLFNIGLLHCDLDGSKDSPYAPCTKSDLENLKYNYWALGHIHIPNDYYSGTIQGRNTKETGEHGVKYVKVENGVITKNTFVALDVIRFEDLNIDLSNAQEITSALTIIQENIEELKIENCELAYLRLNLTGLIDFYNEINEEFFTVLKDKLHTNFNNKINISQINNNTFSKIDNEALNADDGIAGALYKVINNNENTDKTFNNIEKELKHLLKDCYFNDEEYEMFKTEIKIKTKEKCKNLCSLVYESHKD